MIIDLDSRKKVIMTLYLAVRPNARLASTRSRTGYSPAHAHGAELHEALRYQSRCLEVHNRWFFCLR